MTWQPIETAPKDVPIIAWDGAKLAIVEWSNEMFWPELATGDLHLPEGFYCVGEDHLFRNPTHWHPCPSPPQ